MKIKNTPFLKKLIIIVSIILVLSILLIWVIPSAIGRWMQKNEIRYAFSFDEEWIIGKTPEEIILRYGEFDMVASGGRLRGYFLKTILDGMTNYEESPSRYYSLESFRYYFIYFNENNVASSAYVKNDDRLEYRYHVETMQEMFDCFVYAKSGDLQPNETYSIVNIEAIKNLELSGRESIIVPKPSRDGLCLDGIDVYYSHVEYVFCFPDGTNRMTIAVYNELLAPQQRVGMDKLSIGETKKMRVNWWVCNRDGVVFDVLYHNTDIENPCDLVTLEEYTVTASGVTLVE